MTDLVEEFQTVFNDGNPLPELKEYLEVPCAPSPWDRRDRARGRGVRTAACSSRALHLPQGIVNDRADVILDQEAGTPGALALVDYKTATAADIGGDDVYAFQLAVYAAAGQGEGMNVRAAYVHELSRSTRREVDVGRPRPRRPGRGQAP